MCAEGVLRWGPALRSLHYSARGKAHWALREAVPDFLRAVPPAGLAWCDRRLKLCARSSANRSWGADWLTPDQS
jgi:hypothetical protein